MCGLKTRLVVCEALEVGLDPGAGSELYYW